LQEHCGIRFEANAQSFRIVTLLEPKKYNRLQSPVKRPLGLDLSKATLKAMTKYPWTDRSPQTEQMHGKFGIYEASDDLEYFSWLWDGEPDRAHRTHATEILEAADDLAYAVHDIEDGIWAGMIPVSPIADGDEWAIERISRMAERLSLGMFATPDLVAAEIESVFGRLRNSRWSRGPFDQSRSSEGGLKSFCSALTDELIREVTDGGKLNWSDNIALQRRITVLKAVIWVWMIDPPQLVMPRYAQRRIVSELFVGFLDEPGMLPYQGEWRRVAKRGETERARFVCDHVASMTDQYAQMLHARMFNGRT
jgi:dGTPase